MSYLFLWPTFGVILWFWMFASRGYKYPWPEWKTFCLSMKHEKLSFLAFAFVVLSVTGPLFLVIMWWFDRKEKRDARSKQEA